MKPIYHHKLVTRLNLGGKIYMAKNRGINTMIIIVMNDQWSKVCRITIVKGWTIKQLKSLIHQTVKQIAIRIGWPIYKGPYPKEFDYMDFPRGSKILIFTLFSKEGNQWTIENIDRLLFNVEILDLWHLEVEVICYLSNFSTFFS